MATHVGDVEELYAAAATDSVLSTTLHFAVLVT